MECKDEKLLIGDNYICDIKQEELNIKEETEDENDHYSKNNYSIEIKQEIKEEILPVIKEENENLVTVVEESECPNSKKTVSKTGLKLTKHSGEKNYKCPYCEKSFSLKRYLTIHLVVHDGEKKFKCSICQKSFSTKNYLRTHLVIHTGQKNHKCLICKKLFTQKSALNVHLVVHTGAKNHKCTICEKSFSQKSHLNRHLVLIHRDEEEKL